MFDCIQSKSHSSGRSFTVVSELSLTFPAFSACNNPTLDSRLLLGWKQQRKDGLKQMAKLIVVFPCKGSFI